jgi:hypothetical protein
MVRRPFSNLSSVSSSWDEIIRVDFENFVLGFAFRFNISVALVSLIKNVNKITLVLIHLFIRY